MEKGKIQIRRSYMQDVSVLLLFAVVSFIQVYANSWIVSLNGDII